MHSSFSTISPGVANFTWIDQANQSSLDGNGNEGEGDEESDDGEVQPIISVVPARHGRGGPFEGRAGRSLWAAADLTRGGLPLALVNPAVRLPAELPLGW